MAVVTDFDASCELCEAARFTHWYAEDDVCWVADCEACLVPMVVWKPHGTEPSAKTVAHMHEVLRTAAAERFGPDIEVVIDTNMRQIPTHWHAHARDPRWHQDRSQRRLSRFTTVGGQRQERG